MARLIVLIFVLGFAVPAAAAADITATPKAKSGAIPASERCTYRSAITGHFVSEYYAKRHPRTTVRDCVR